MLSSLAAHGEAERPKIYLQKKVIAEKKGKKVKYFEIYKMKRGDTVWKIFVSRLEGRNAEFGIFLDAFKNANPDIPNPAFIREGKNVRLPVTAGTLGKKKVIREKLVKGSIKKYKVKSGDTLWNIASSSKRLKGGRWKYIREVVKLNPFLSNPDKIYPGQKLYLPEAVKRREKILTPPPLPIAKKAVPEETPHTISPVKEVKKAETTKKVKKKEIVKRKPEKNVKKPFLDKSVVSEQKNRSGFAYPEKLLEKRKKGKAKEKLKEVPGGETNLKEMKNREKSFEARNAYRGLLEDILSALGGSLILSGKMYLPLGGGGEIVLDMSRYPLAKFKSGERVILDQGGTIPDELKHAILDRWKGYTILTFSLEDGPEPLMRDLMKSGGFYSVKEGKKTSLTIGSGVSLKIEADLIIMKDKDSILKGEIFAIRHVKDPKISERVAHVYSYGQSAGITLIPYFVDPAIEDGFVPSYLFTEDTYIGKVTTLPSKPGEVVSSLLHTFGVRQSRSHTISIKGPGGAYTLNIKPDLVFWVGKKSYVLDPDRFSGPIRKLLVREGFTVFPLPAGMDLDRLIEKVLSASGIHFSRMEKGRIAGGEREGYSLVAKGFYIKGSENKKGKNTLLLRGSVDRGMRGLLLGEFGTRVITY